MEQIYHYTTQVHMARIRETGYLQPSHVLLDPGEKSLLWFSAHPHWEPSVKKMIRRPEGVFLLSFEQLRKALGCVRLSIASSDPRLMSRQTAYNYAGTPVSTRERLDHIGRQCGAEPDQWRAVASPIPLGELGIEFLDREEWLPSEHSADLDLRSSKGPVRLDAQTFSSTSRESRQIGIFQEELQQNRRTRERSR